MQHSLNCHCLWLLELVFQRLVASQRVHRQLVRVSQQLVRVFLPQERLEFPSQEVRELQLVWLGFLPQEELLPQGRHLWSQVGQQGRLMLRWSEFSCQHRGWSMMDPDRLQRPSQEGLFL
jgi:hypothetical protein